MTVSKHCLYFPMDVQLLEVDEDVKNIMIMRRNLALLSTFIALELYAEGLFFICIFFAQLYCHVYS